MCKIGIEKKLNYNNHLKGLRRLFPNFQALLLRFLIEKAIEAAMLIKANGRIVLTLDGWTASKWISSVLIVASARWCVIDYCTLCVKATWTFAWINTSLINTCSIGWTLWIDCTLRTAIRWSAKVAGCARTCWTFVDNFAFCIRTTWCRDARVLRLRQFLTYCITCRKWVTRKSRCAATDGIVVYHVTFWIEIENIQTDEFNLL